MLFCARPVLVVSLFFTIFCPAALSQQVAPAVDRAAVDQTIREAMRIGTRSTRSQAAQLSPSQQQEINLLDREFGVQQVQGIVTPKPPAYLLMLESSGFYTSNAALSAVGARSDWVARPGLRAAWVPQITERWSLLAMSYYSLWRYEELQQINFDDFGAQAWLQYQIGRNDLPGALSRFTGWGGYRYQRLTSPWNWGNLLYDNHFVEIGGRAAWSPLSRVSVWLGGNAAVSVAGAPTLLRRHEFSVQSGALWQLTPRLRFTALYRLALFDYVDVSRHDLNHLFFLGVGCQIMKNLRTDLFVNGVLNRSSGSPFSYNALNTGLSLQISQTW
ncbi:MAG: hypothetical protein JWR15_4392 [Prosthecobacter sp.]|nr:hypothetical protein [Prosthecobacter sp.]